MNIIAPGKMLRRNFSGKEEENVNGLYLYQGKNNAGNADETQFLSLLAKKGNLEVMTQRVTKGATAWLYPAGDPSDMEFYFVHSGEMEIVLSDGETRRVGPGDSFCAQNLHKNVLMRCLEDALLLYVSTCPAFDEQQYWQKELQALLRRVDEYDHNTRRHSRAVMRYAVHLYEALADKMNDVELEDFIVAALFHDVGKCNVPGSILRKRGKLTAEEYEIVKCHPQDSATILRPMYGEKIAAITHMHHERMDGSGYPQGLKGDEIPLEARILMVADSFDAMTSDRGYNQVMSLEEAAAEIVEKEGLYDPLVAGTLQELVRSGQIKREEETEL